jgi:hypothetical protein
MSQEVAVQTTDGTLLCPPRNSCGSKRVLQESKRSIPARDLGQFHVNGVTFRLDI